MSDLIEACLSADPEERPTARQLVAILSDASAAGTPSLRRTSSKVRDLCACMELVMPTASLCGHYDAQVLTQRHGSCCAGSQEDH